jgi:outer membrane protein
MRLPVIALALLSAGASIPTTIAAQSAPTPGSTLTLTQAVALARQNNPQYLSASTQRRVAAANMRAANGAFLPNLNTSFDAGYREGRPTLFQGQTFGSTNDQVETNVSAGAQMNLSLATFSDRRLARANAEATEADISATEANIRNLVTAQFLTTLQAQARAVLQDTLLATTAAQLELARARFQVGSGTQLDVQRAEVANGQQQVASLNARNQAEIEKVRLFQQMGVDVVQNVRLDSDLPATPTLNLSDVLHTARTSNPQLDAARMREQAARASVSSARSSYLPSLNLSAGVSGYTNRFTNTDLLITGQQSSIASQRASCIRSEEVRDALGLPNRLSDCEGIAFTADDEAAIRDSQGRYPFDFSRNPYSFRASLSLPIFNGFRREQQVAQANAQRRNAEIEVRNQLLRVQTDVNTAFLQYTNAQQTVAMQDQNVRTARLALSLAQERYRVGAISLVELVQARGDYERAETDRITAIYDVQRAFAALEAAAGRPLR